MSEYPREYLHDVENTVKIAPVIDRVVFAISVIPNSPKLHSYYTVSNGSKSKLTELVNNEN